MNQNNRSSSKSPRLSIRFTVSLTLSVTALAATLPVRAQVQSVVSTSQVNLTPAGGVSAGPAVTDACGNVYVNENGQVVQFAAGTGAQTVIVNNTYGYGGPNAIAIDSTKTYLYAPTPTAGWYSSSWSVFTLNNCVPSGPTGFPATGVSYLYSSYYFGTAQVLAVDGYGDVFFVPTQGSNTNSIAEIACGASPGVACTQYPSGTNAAVLVSSLPKQPVSMAADAKGNVFYTDGSANVYELAAPYKSAPFTIGSGFTQPVGVTFDSKGNLLISDSNGYNSNIYYTTTFTSVVYEIPNESGTLNPSHQFTVAKGLGIAAEPAIDANGNLYYTAYPPSQYQNLNELVLNSAQLPTTKTGSSASNTINYVFNATVTPATISVNSGTAASAAFSNAGGGCSATTYTVGQTCSVTINYKPTVPGVQTGAVIFADASKTALSTTTLSGTGLGSGITIDPGKLVPFTGTFKQPEGVASDAQGDFFVADAGNNSIIEFPAGTSTGTAVSTGSITLNAPSGVAVDGVGNLYIANTGANTIVEVPVVKGALAPASSSTLSISANSTALKSPGGLAVDSLGNLYIADTGNNRVVVVPSVGGVLLTSNAVSYGSGLNGPLGLTVDLNGNVYVADSGNGAIVKLAYPLTSKSQVNVATGLSSPSAVSSDASGSIYVVNKGTNSVEKFSLISGLFSSPAYVGGTIAAPYGVTVDAYGNLLVTDSTNALVTGVARVQTNLPFGNWNVSATSTPQTATIGNSGNASLLFTTPDYTAGGATAAGFTVTNDGCSSAGTIVTGSNCLVTATFTPSKTETNATETLTLNSNASNGSPVLSLVGTGEVITATTTTISLTAPTSGTLSAGVSATFSATIGTGAGTTAPTGYVTFFVNGTQDGPEVSITKTGSTYSAPLTFPNGLPAGSVLIQAVYSGDSNYSGSQGSINESVVGLVAALTLTATTPYINPQSANDNPSNATGPSVPLTATLAITSKIIPTGTVKFYSGTTSSPVLLGIGSLSPTASGYQATITETALRALTGTTGEDGSIINNFSLFAVYSGDNYYNPETAPSVPLTIVGAPATQAACAAAPQMTITNTSLSGGIATYTYTYTPSSTNTPPAAGDIITVAGTSNGLGVLNVTNATINSVSIGGAGTGTFTIKGFSTTKTVVSASDSGTASPVCEPNTTGATFIITPANPTLTITSSNASGPVSGTVVLTVTSLGGWTGVLNFTCSNLPAYAVCAPYPGAPTVLASPSNTANTPTQVQFTINTNVPPVVPNASGFLWWTSGLFGIAFLFARRRLARLGLQRLGTTVALLLLMISSIGAATGCGSSVNNYTTPTGTTNVLVTVSAAQVQTTGSNGSVTLYPKDVNAGSFTIALTVK